MSQIDVTHVSLKNTAPNTVFKGYFGGTFTNKWNNQSLAIYQKAPSGALTCQTLPYSADLKKKIPNTAAWVEIKFLGCVNNGRYNYNNFDVVCSPLPAGNAKAAEFMSILQTHTRSLNVGNASSPNSANNPWGAMAESEPKSDPFAALDTVTATPKSEPEYPF